MKEFYIVNDVDRPDERHVVERFIGRKGAYIHPDLRKWNDNNGYFQIVSGCTNIKDFGFSIEIIKNTNTGIKDRVTFNKTGPSTATYKDGRKRPWQGKNSFSLLPYGVPALVISKKIVWSCEDMPEVTIENCGGSIYHVMIEGKESYVFTNHDKNKVKAVKEWFNEEIIKGTE